MQFTVEQQGLVWEGWRRGESQSLIARSLGCHFQQVRRFLIRHGGIRPPEQRRHRLHLTGSEREEISRGISAGLSAREIARRLGRACSSVSEEIRRNGGRANYRALEADLAATDRARRPKQCRLETNLQLRAGWCSGWARLVTRADRSLAAVGLHTSRTTPRTGPAVPGNPCEPGAGTDTVSG